MKSIRLSLVVYFLLLEALALGAGSWLVYRTAKQSLEAEQETKRMLLVSQYEDLKHEVRTKLDDELLSHARTIANITVARFRPEKLNFVPLMSLGLLTSSTAPHGDLLAPIWLATGLRPSPINSELRSRIANEIALTEDWKPQPTELAGPEYTQINSRWGASWRSANLEKGDLPFDRTRLMAIQQGEWILDDLELPSGQMGRRVQLKTSITRFLFRRDLTNPPPPGSRGSSGAPRQPAPQPPPRPPTERITESFFPWIVVHCASDVEGRNARMARLSSELDSKTSQLNREAVASLDRLWKGLLLVGVATFVATAIGGLLLVGIGLAPLQRLSEAVSQVTPKDFRLPVDDQGIPRELSPIVTRLRETLNQLRIAFEREKQAVADISHELRTPVSAILATLDVALRKPRTAEEYRETIVEARSVGGHLRQLVERVLTLARLDAGVARVAITSVDLSDLVNQSLALVRPIAAEKGLSLVSDVPPGLSWSTDADKLREILINLLHNAVHYNKPAGSVRVGAVSRGDTLELAVSDTGVGIRPEEIPYLFERFYRSDPSRGEAALHAGLGLAIVRGYAELLGGTVSVDSIFGSGTTFRITLPQLEMRIEGREAA
jgi:signal transduction histidine kinase